MAKFAIILAGCGVYDGSEIHEAVLTMLALSERGVDYDIFAPNSEQFHVINHITGEETDQKRNILEESARIARGNISALDTIVIEDYDAVIFPGGFGVAKNLCNYAFKGTDMEVLQEVKTLIKKAYVKGIAIGGICISPVMLAKVLGKGAMTVGNNPDTGRHLEEMGVKYCGMDSTEVCIDKDNKIVTAPAYMNDASVEDVYKGISKLADSLLNLLK